MADVSSAAAVQCHADGRAPTMPPLLQGWCVAAHSPVWAAAANIHEPWALRCGIQNKKRCLPKLSSLPTEALFENGLGGRQSALRAYRATLEMMSLLARRFWVQLVWPCCISSFGPSFISKCA